MHRGLGGEGRVEHTRLRRAGESHDAAPPAIAHARHDRMGQFADTEKVEDHALFPLLLGRVELNRPALPGCIHQDVDMAQQTARLGGDAFRCVLFVEIGRQRNDLAASRAGDFAGQLFNEFDAPGDRDDIDARLGQHARGRAANALACAGDQCGPAFEVQFHLQPYI